MTSVISLRGVGKAYRQYPSKWAKLWEWVVPFRGMRHRRHWVLKDINLEIGAKEAVALVGFNGAGKSTLLKIIAGTLQPTEGEVIVRGRVSALLELGIGFHEEFTGRQNVYMAGQLMGLELDEITRLMPEIERFADIGEYIDQPVRTYSSGMHVRLAFSIATARRPEVLIVDEALSVGDAAFQHKSFERIKQFREAGTTLLVVTHDRHAVESICDRAVLINHGTVEQAGHTTQVLDYYHALMAEKDGSRITQEKLPDGRVKTSSGSAEVVVSDVYMRSEGMVRKDTYNVGEFAQICVEVDVQSPVEQLVVGVLIKNRFGQEIYGINSDRLKCNVYSPEEGSRYMAVFSVNMNIGVGYYTISVALSGHDSHIVANYQWVDGAYVFQMANKNRENFIGACWLDAGLTIDRVR